MRSPDDPVAPIAALFDEHCDFVCRVLQHHGVHEAALDDAVQDVFVTAHLRWSSFEGRSSARSWLFGIARRIAFRYRRSANAWARHFVDPGDRPPEGADDPHVRARAVHSLAAMLGRLDPRKRAVFILREIEGLTASEAADALRIPIGTVNSRLRSAWQALGRQAEREQLRLRRELRAQRAPAVSEDRRRRMWGLIVGGLGPRSTAAPTGMSWLAQLKWAAVGAALGAGLLGARVAMVRAASRPPPAAPVHEPESRVRRPAPVAATQTRATTPTPARLDQASPAEPAPLPTAIDPRTSPLPARRRPPRRGSRPETPPGPDALTIELELLQRARAALDTGRARDALELLREHAERFPRGQLAGERRVTRIEALCAEGRRDQASREARALGREPACP